jgi:hypothetical protein
MSTLIPFVLFGIKPAEAAGSPASPEENQEHKDKKQYCCIIFEKIIG